MTVEIATASPEGTEDIGRRVGQDLDGGATIALRGELGAGKTCFVRGLAAGLGVDPEAVTSPSFTLIADHEGGRFPFAHVDLFRLEPETPESDLREIGLDDVLDRGGVTAIEWADRLGFDALRAALYVEIELREGDRRIVRLRSGSSLGDRILRGLRDFSKQP